MPKAKISLVLDTSILISALKSRDEAKSPAWLILNCLKSDLLQNHVPDGILDEMKFTLALIALKYESKLGHSIHKRAHDIFRIIKTHSKKVTSKVDFSKEKTIKEKLKDEDDLKFLEILYTVKAKFLITRNTKHFGNFVIEKDKKTGKGKKTGKARLKQHYFYVLTDSQFKKHLQTNYPEETEKCRKRRAKKS